MFQNYVIHSPLGKFGLPSFTSSQIYQKATPHLELVSSSYILIHYVLDEARVLG